MRSLACTIMLMLAACSTVFAMGEDQLYTGDASTVQPGLTQFQLYYVTPFSNDFSLGGASLRFGTTGNTDVRVAYGYLWNDRGPDVQFGPNIGVKWRFAGDGRRRPSMSFSALWALNDSVRTGARKGDTGALLILQYPTKPVILLANVGRVWTGDSSPDLLYLAFAAARRVTQRVLLAAEYVSVDPLGGNGSEKTQYVLGMVYVPDKRLGYSLQLGYLPDARESRTTITLGLSRYF